MADELRGIRGGGLGTATTYLGVALARMGHSVEVLYVGAERWEVEVTGRAAHAVMILDVATSPAGRVKVMLGEGGNPAQTFHVLRAEDGTGWFAVSKSTGIALRGKESLKLKDLRHWR